MNGPGRNGTLSPVSLDSTDWSPSNYQGSNPPYSPSLTTNRGNLVTPPASSHASASTTDGGMSNGMGRRAPSNGNPSPPSSIARSSISDGERSRRAMMIEETLAEHYEVLKTYLGPYLRDEKGNPRPNRARDKLLRLSSIQFQELSTDVYDESKRRDELQAAGGGKGAPGNTTPAYLLPKPNFHPKRNQARQKLSTLPPERFRQLATDVFFELERRYPRFTGADIERSTSPTNSMRSMRSNRSLGPPRSGTPNGGMRPPPPGMRGPPPPGGYRNGPPPNGMYGGPPGSGGANEYGKPLPKTFQQNTIIPNKSTMVEDDDESNVEGSDDDQDSFGLEGAAQRQSRRATNKSLKSLGGQSDKMITDLQAQVADLQSKVGGYETQMQGKNEEIERLQDAEKSQGDTHSADRAGWDDLRESLERKLEEAQGLNNKMRAELDRVRSDNDSAERDLREQLEQANVNAQRSSNDDELQYRCDQLEQELDQQRRVTDEVRREARQHLIDMRGLSEQNDKIAEKEERLQRRVQQLEGELEDWKSRYARTKTQLRTLRASSIGLAMQSPDASVYAKDNQFTDPNGLVTDVNVTKFQLAIDDLLQTARKTEQPASVIERMKSVVVCVRGITADVDAGPSTADADTTKRLVKLKSQVSATANNLITASKNYAAASGLSPVSLLDAAASHLSTAVVELVRTVKVRPTPAGELERDNDDDEDLDRPMPLAPQTLGKGTYNSNMSNSMSNNMTNGYGQGHIRSRSSKGSGSSLGYSSIASSPRRTMDSSWATRRSDALSGVSGIGGGLNGAVADRGLEEFKNYLEDQTATLVHSIQPLVHTIRSKNPNEDISIHLNAIASTVADISAKTQSSIKNLDNPALSKHAPPVVDILDDCRGNLERTFEDGDGMRERIPPIAFRIARATKELVLRVDRIESGDLTAAQNLTTEV